MWIKVNTPVTLGECHAFRNGFDSGQQSAQVALAHERQRYEELRVKVEEFLQYAEGHEYKSEVSHPFMPEELTKLRQAIEPVCGECGGTGGIDSGGMTPWGTGINIPCPSCGPQSQAIEPKEDK